MRFRSEQHLRRQSDIKAVREQGRRIECGAFTFWWLQRHLPAEGSEPCVGPRLCAVASIAAVGKSVHRARAKRRLRELFRLHQERIAPTIDVMLVARAAGNRQSFEELEKRFLQACAKLPQPPVARG